MFSPIKHLQVPHFQNQFCSLFKHFFKITTSSRFAIFKISSTNVSVTNSSKLQLPTSQEILKPCFSRILFKIFKKLYKNLINENVPIVFIKPKHTPRNVISSKVKLLSNQSTQLKMQDTPLPDLHFLNPEKVPEISLQHSCICISGPSPFFNDAIKIVQKENIYYQTTLLFRHWTQRDI